MEGLELAKFKSKLKRFSSSKLIMVGAEGFEPPTLCSQSRCATRLRYAPTDAPIVSRNGFVLYQARLEDLP